MSVLTGTVPYAQSLTSQDVPPPYHFPNVTVNAFAFEVPMGPVQAYCDAMFNLGPVETRRFVYKPMAAWPYALLLFIEYPQMICSDRNRENIGGLVGYQYRGVVSQTEVFLAIPVARYGVSPAGFILDSTMDMALPFIVVGNPMSAVCGREMLGLEKLLADIETGEGPFPDSFRGTVSLPGWRTGAPGENQEMLPFVSVATEPAMPTFWGSIAQASPYSLLQSRAGGEFVQGLAALTGFADRATYGMMPLTMRTVSLKQFRDAADPSTAIYQALVTCRSRYVDVENFRFYNEDRMYLNFQAYASFRPILEVFVEPEALVPGAPAVARAVKAAFRFNATIEFDEMRTIYTAPIDPGPTVSPVPPGRNLIARWWRPWAGFIGAVPK